jgi:hypothetical protein
MKYGAMLHIFTRKNRIRDNSIEGSKTFLDDMHLFRCKAAIYELISTFLSRPLILMRSVFFIATHTGIDFVE